MSVDTLLLALAKLPRNANVNTSLDFTVSKGREIFKMKLKGNERLAAETTETQECNSLER